MQMDALGGELTGRPVSQDVSLGLVRGEGRLVPAGGQCPSWLRS